MDSAAVLSLPLEALQATLLSVLSGELKVKDGALVASEKSTGPRGPTAKVAPRLEACRESLMALIEVGPTTAIDLLKVSEDRFVYTDILLVAKSLLADGTIVETRKGRKATWSKPSEE